MPSINTLKLHEYLIDKSVNLKHKLIKKLGNMSGKEFSNFAEFLFDYAIIAEGGSPKDPAKYLRQLDKYSG